MFGIDRTPRCRRVLRLDFLFQSFSIFFIFITKPSSSRHPHFIYHLRSLFDCSKYPIVYQISQDSCTYTVLFWLRDQTPYPSYPRSSSTSSPALLHLNTHPSSIICGLSPIVWKPDSHTFLDGFHRYVACRHVDLTLHFLFPRRTQSTGQPLHFYKYHLTLRQCQSYLPDKYEYLPCQTCI